MFRSEARSTLVTRNARSACSNAASVAGENDLAVSTTT